MARTSRTDLQGGSRQHGEWQLALDPVAVDGFRRELQSHLTHAANGDAPVALVCGQALRRPLQRLVAGIGLDAPVLAYPELPSDVELLPTGVIGLAATTA